MKNDNIEKLRKKVDTVDGKVVYLLAERFKITKEILSLKKKNGLGVKDQDREDAILKTVGKLAKKLIIDPSVVINIFRSILKESKK
jgi:chorismate mutase